MTNSAQKFHLCDDSIGVERTAQGVNHASHETTRLPPVEEVNVTGGSEGTIRVLRYLLHHAVRKGGYSSAARFS